MPIRVPDELPAVSFLRNENVFVMPSSRAATQEIRPLKVLVLNLMPKRSRQKTNFFDYFRIRRYRLIYSYCALIAVSRKIRLPSIWIISTVILKTLKTNLMG